VRAGRGGGQQNGPGEEKEVVHVTFCQNFAGAEAGV
jgi:hypothetical protein